MPERGRALASVCVVLGGWLALAAVAAAQPIKQPEDPLDAAPGAAPAAGATAATTADGKPRVVGVRSAAHPERPLQAGLGERITVEVQGLEAALATVPNGCTGLILFLDGTPIRGVPPESCVPELGRVRFLLDRTPDSDAAWRGLLGKPAGLKRTIMLSMGPGSDVAWPTEVHDFELEILPKGMFLLCMALLAAMLVVLIVVARRTALLRDPHAVAPAGTLAPYSLSRFQLAFWTYLAIAAYVFIWMITLELDTVTGSVLALLGIGSGTALGASMIAQGKGKAATGGTGGAVALPAGNGADTPAAPAPAASPAPAAGGVLVSGATASASGPAATRVAASQGFLTDVLNGSQGMSLYRFQMLGWTLVLGIIFCFEVYSRLSMPEFSPSLLALMGISSATYLGAKFPEE